MVENAMNVAHGISEFGMMAVTAAFFIVMAAGLMVACFKWFKAIINGMIDGNSKVMSALLAETRNQNNMLADISEGLRPETQLRIRNTSNAFFDLAVERVCRMVKKIREENHIADRQAVKAKIHTMLENIHEDRNSKFDCYTFRGRKLSAFTSTEWVEWVAGVVENEVYNESVNNGRTYTNVTSVYNRIRVDFYHNLNNK